MKTKCKKQQKTLEITKLFELNNIFKNESVYKPNNNCKINDKMDKTGYICVEEKVNSFFINNNNN